MPVQDSFNPRLSASNLPELTRPDDSEVAERKVNGISTP